jgi:hypothetical protein
MPVPPGQYVKQHDLTGYFILHNYVPLETSGSVPPAPSGVIATAGSSQVTLTWDSSFRAASYAVKRSATSGGPYVVIAPRVYSVLYRDTAVIPFTTYYYVVVAVNLSGESENSAEVSATPESVPDAPTGLELTAYGLPVTDVGLSWTEATGATSYNVYRRTQPGGAWGLVQSGVAATTYVDHLTLNETFNYSVTAVNTAGESGMSVLAAIDAYGNLAAPVLSAETSGNSTVLTWTRPTGVPTSADITGFQGATGTQPYSYTSPSWVTSHTVSLLEGTNYFSVSGSNPVGVGPASNTVYVIYPEPGGGSSWELDINGNLVPLDVGIGGTWEADVNGDLTPLDTTVPDDYWEEDINGNLEPK